ncbi:amidase [Sandarakinorhabdus rubra]|uniref:amidase n=1 Tax=Sandarakinorhabdus rubra TaxID=2672568 RepID=UPI0013DBAE9E|nr:amidase family protein [Sandarakinorhabdus rubra]
MLRTLMVIAMVAATQGQAAPLPFAVEEATIGSVHAAMRDGRLTCRGLVDAYLARITAYDKNGPAVNAIVTINPDATSIADDLDRRFAAGGLTGPLHCVPMIVKDNFETQGLQTSNGALAFAGYLPAQDATLVARARAAGAIVLAKSNMAEWAFSPVETVSSILPGYTKNPYALDRVTAGSSGGTAAAIAANFGLVGLGSDTGDSIRGPASHTNLAGIRSTMGLTSRAGVFPLNLRADIAGPMTRTVEDMAIVFQAIAGADPRDPATATATGRTLPDVRTALDRGGLKGVRIGVLREAYERDSSDPEIVAIFRAALDDLRRQGAIIVDPAPIEGYALPPRPAPDAICMGFKHDLNQFLAARASPGASQVPLADLAAILQSGRFHPSVAKRLEDAEKVPQNGTDSPACAADEAQREAFRTTVLKTMARLKLDAFVYPTWSNPPRLIGDLNTPGGDNSQVFAPITGFPAVNVPMGHSRGGLLPVGITFLGRPWADVDLIRFAYAYEQATRHRRPPPSTPPLR